MTRFFTSESVTKGHPDKICDQISDGILDALLKQDPYSRCACETTVEPNAVHIMGEITTKANIDYIQIARSVIKSIGYTKDEYGFTDKCNITCSLHEQSPDIAMGVDNAYEDKDELGAGDQGMMFGYASSETEELMPLAIALARNLTSALTYARENNILNYLRPDGKAQVTIEYEDNVAKRIDAVVLSTQHDPEVSLEQLREDMKKYIIIPNLPKRLLDDKTKYFINPTGRFVLGGPAADTGLTGRKIIVDTYGGYCSHGGGAFSGKDATKVDRTGAYVARNIAKTIVAAKVAKECEIQLSYAIGVASPISLMVKTDKDALLSEDTLINWINSHYDLRPAKMIERFSLRSPIYEACASGGHFGRTDIIAPWEIVDPKAVADLQALL